MDIQGKKSMILSFQTSPYIKKFKFMALQYLFVKLNHHPLMGCR